MVSLRRIVAQHLSKQGKVPTINLIPGQEIYFLDPQAQETARSLAQTEAQKDIVEGRVGWYTSKNRRASMDLLNAFRRAGLRMQWVLTSRVRDALLLSSVDRTVVVEGLVPRSVELTFER